MPPQTVFITMGWQRHGIREVPLVKDLGTGFLLVSCNGRHVRVPRQNALKTRDAAIVQAQSLRTRVIKLYEERIEKLRRMQFGPIEGFDEIVPKKRQRLLKKSALSCLLALRRLHDARHPAIGAEIARTANMDYQYTLVVLRSLVKKGLVARDDAKKTYALTSEGKAALPAEDTL